MQAYKFRKHFEIGKLDAETDSFLESCFYESDIFKGIINFDSSGNNPDFTRRIIVGRTGSGKTALLKQILKSDSIKNHETIEAENTVFEHIKNNVFISQLMNNGVDLRVFYKSLWLHVLLIKVINLLHRSSYESFFRFIKELGSSKKYKPDLANEYIEKYRDNFFNNNIVTEISNVFQAELGTKIGSEFLNLSGSVSRDSLEKIQYETSSYVSKELLSKQKELIKILKTEFSNEGQHKIVISIDDLDKSWLSSSSIRYDFINALLDAFREIIDVKTVKILISIRTDILMGIYKNSLRQNEKDLSLIYAISWNKKEIREILDSRINHLIKNQYSSSRNTSFSEVFDFYIDSVKADEYILARTMLRPRDAIHFVNLCLAECDGSVYLNDEIVLSAEEKFYSYRKRALATEWSSIYPDIEHYLDSLSLINSRVFNISDLKDNEIDRIQNYLLDKCDTANSTHSEKIVNFSELMRVWFTIGVIGIKRTESVTIYSSFEKPELDITDIEKSFEIHPLFFRY